MTERAASARAATPGRATIATAAGTGAGRAIVAEAAASGTAPASGPSDPQVTEDGVAGGVVAVAVVVIVAPIPIPTAGTVAVTTIVGMPDPAAPAPPPAGIAAKTLKTSVVPPPSLPPYSSVASWSGPTVGP